MNENLNMNMNIIEYNDKSFVLTGETKPFKEEIKKMGGKWNANLKDGIKGWIFSNKKRDVINNWLKSFKTETNTKPNLSLDDIIKLANENLSDDDKKKLGMFFNPTPEPEPVPELNTEKYKYALDPNYSAIRDKTSEMFNDILEFHNRHKHTDKEHCLLTTFQDTFKIKILSYVSYESLKEYLLNEEKYEKYCDFVDYEYFENDIFNGRAFRHWDSGNEPYEYLMDEFIIDDYKEKTKKPEPEPEPEPEIEIKETGYTNGWRYNTECKYSKMTVKQLKEICRDRKLVMSGNKDKIIERLKNYDNENN